MLTRLQSVVYQLMLLDIPDSEICKRLSLSYQSVANIRERIQNPGKWKPEDEQPDERPVEDGKLPPDTSRWCIACEATVCECSK